MMLNEGEVELYYWQMRRSGSFSTALFDMIAKADIHNQSKLALGFPEEVEAFQRYQNEKGYWAMVQEAMQS